MRRERTDVEWTVVIVEGRGGYNCDFCFGPKNSHCVIEDSKIARQSFIGDFNKSLLKAARAVEYIHQFHEPNEKLLALQEVSEKIVCLKKTPIQHPDCSFLPHNSSIMGLCCAKPKSENEETPFHGILAPDPTAAKANNTRGRGRQPPTANGGITNGTSSSNNKKRSRSGRSVSVDRHGNSVFDDDGSRFFGALYEKYRENARVAGDRMATNASKAEKAWTGGKKADAKRFSTEKKKDQAEMEKYNKLAVQEILKPQRVGVAGSGSAGDSKGAGRAGGSIGGGGGGAAGWRSGKLDLHGLFVKEAEVVVTDFLDYWCDKRNRKKLCLEGRGKNGPIVEIITGAGHHSKKGCKILPMTRGLICKRGLKFDAEAHGGAVLVYV